MRNSTTGTMSARNRAAIPMLSSYSSTILGRATEMGCMSGRCSTSSGQRKSFHDATIVSNDTTARIGFDSGSTRLTRIRTPPAPSILAASNSSRGSESKNRLITSTLNAFAAAGSHTAQYVLSRLTPRPGMSRIVR